MAVRLCVVVLACVGLAIGQQGSLSDMISDINQNRGQDFVDNAGGSPDHPGGSANQQADHDNGGADLNCECVPYYLCTNSSFNIEDSTLLDIGINESPCEDYLEVCCQKSHQLTSNNAITSAPHTSTGCGQRNPDGVGFRITGDHDGEAQYAEFPWMVALLREEAVDGSEQRLDVYQCGGSLIHPQVVLTAAHCVANQSSQGLKIRAGEWDTQSKNELFPHQDRLVEKIVTHEGYSAGVLYNDVALLFLHEPVTAAENVDVVCLPEQGAIFDNSRCVASGWGKDVYGKEGRDQVILKKIDLPIVPRDKCLEDLRKTRVGPYFQLHESFICAGGEAKKDTCMGDGGSPLVCPLLNDPLHYQQTGIVAWGIGCGEDRTPGVYANVALFRDWIDDKIVSHNLDTSTYTF